MLMSQQGNLQQPFFQSLFLFEETIWATA